MPTYGWGGATSGGTFSAGTVYSDGIPLPSGRADCNGYTAVVIIQLYAYVRGHSANPVGTIQLGSTATGAVTATSAADSNPGIGYYGCTPWLVNGGTTRFQWNGPSSGPVWVGRGGGGTVNGAFGSRAGQLGGAAQYAQCPSQCGTPAVAPSTDGTQATVTFTGPADNGDSAVTGYNLQRADDAGFTVNVATVASSGTTLFTGLTPGKTYYYRVTAKNIVAAYTGALGGPWSATAVGIQPSSGTGKIRNAANTSWVPGAAKIRNSGNTAWVDAAGVERNLANSAWVPVG